MSDATHLIMSPYDSNRAANPDTLEPEKLADWLSRGAEILTIREWAERHADQILEEALVLIAAERASLN
jgi:hypothetical protein